MELLNKLIIILPLILPLIPVVLKLLGLLGQLTSSKKLHNLVDRSDRIVAALEQSNISNESKQTAAINKLMIYAREVGINISDGQAQDYIESSYLFLKLMREQQKLEPTLYNQKGEVINGQAEVPGERSEYESQEKNIFTN